MKLQKIEHEATANACHQNSLAGASCRYSGSVDLTLARHRTDNLSNESRNRESGGSLRTRIYNYWFSIPLVLLTWTGGILSSPVQAQPDFTDTAVGIGADDDLSLPRQEPGFQIPQNEEVLTAISDFSRYAGRGDWSRAFQVLQDLPPDKRIGMLRNADGFYIPARERIWREVMTIPAEGREAFRLFYNAKGAQLFEQGREQLARDPKVGGEKLHEVYQDYFLTSVGDEAANLLGDAAFERGEFVIADNYWSAILKHHPEASESEARLMVKRIIALRLAGRPEAAERIQQQALRRFADQQVTFGGTPISVKSILERVAQEETGRSVGRGETPDTGELVQAALPERETEPVWQMRFGSPESQRAIIKTVTDNSWNYSGLQSYVPPIATDGERLFCNWFGITFAVDMKSGKLLWRTDKFGELNDKFPSLHQRSMNMDQFNIQYDQGRLFSLGVRTTNLDEWQVAVRLISIDPNTGRILWNSQQVSGLGDESFLGNPLLVDGMLLALSHPQGGQQLTLRVLDPDTGAERWNTPLGTMAMLSDTNGNERLPIPTMLAEQGKLMILTNNGALIEVDLSRREIESVFRFEGPRTVNDESSTPADRNAIRLHSTASLRQHEGMFYCKEAGGRLLFALDPTDRRILWKRPLDRSAMVVGMDASTIYTMSHELMAIDRETRALKWSISLPIEVGGLSLLAAGDRLLVNTNRGLYELSSKTGDVQRIFRGFDLESNGGSLHRIGNLLLSVSSRSITAYQQ